MTRRRVTRIAGTIAAISPGRAHERVFALRPTTLLPGAVTSPPPLLLRNGGVGRGRSAWSFNPRPRFPTLLRSLPPDREGSGTMFSLFGTPHRQKRRCRAVQRSGGTPNDDYRVT